jgi:hypothetical protein
LIIAAGILIILRERKLGKDRAQQRKVTTPQFQGAMLGIVIVGQCAAAAGVLGTDQPVVLPADRLLAAQARRPGRARAWRWR